MIEEFIAKIENHKLNVKKTGERLHVDITGIILGLNDAILLAREYAQEEQERTRGDSTFIWRHPEHPEGKRITLRRIEED